MAVVTNEQPGHIDAEQVFWICTHGLEPMSAAIDGM
jgi:hypothetical protein